MTAEDILDEVHTHTKTERSRLGSSKSLYAETGGEMDAGPVKRAVADTFRTTADALGDWAGEADDAAADLFESVAETASDHAAEVGADLDDDSPGETPAVVDFLDEQADTAARVGALLGWAIVTDEKVGQAVGFFVGQADPQTASDFRSIGDDLEAIRADALEALDDVLDSVADETATSERATEAAVGAIEAAYEEYVERLEAQGVNPKPVC